MRRAIASRAIPRSSDAPPSRPARRRRARAGRALLLGRARERRGERLVLRDRVAPPLDASGRLEPRERGDEVRAREVVRRRERLAVDVVRSLLGDRRQRRTGSGRRRAGTRAAAARAAARRRARSSMAKTTAVATLRACARLPPGRDALHDEELLARPHVADPPRLALESPRRSSS